MSNAVVRRLSLVAAVILALLVAAQSASAQTATPPIGTFSVGSFENDLFTGASTAQVPIVVPPGAAGVAPAVTLRYNSGTVDDTPARTQGQGAGLGWTLDTGGYIVRDTKATVTTSDDTFKLVYGGSVHDLVKVDSVNNYWHTKDQIFVRLQYNAAGDYWTLQTKDGTQHRYGFTGASKAVALNVDLATNVTYKYLLDQVATASGVAIQYTYTKVTAIAQGTTRSYDQAVYPDRITYAYSGGSIIGGEARQVQFFWAPRTDYTDTHVSTRMSFHEAQRLDHIDVTVASALVRRYVFGFDYSIDRDTGYTWGGGATGDLTLRSVTVYGSDGASTLPGLSFSYTNARLLTATNGIGGSTTFLYEEVKSIPVWSTCLRDDGNGFCIDYGPTTAPPPSGSSSANIWPTSQAGTHPVYLACVRATVDEWGVAFCNDRSIATVPDPYGFSSLLGYALDSNTQGTSPLYSSCATVFSDENGGLHCAEFTVGPSPDSFGGPLVGYAYVTGFDRYRVTSRTTTDGRGGSGTMTFSYTNLAYSSNGKEFRGHASVRAVDPAGHYTINEFDQDDVFKGRPVTSQTFASSGASLIYVNNTWDSVTPFPATTFVRLIATSRIECPAAGGLCRQINQTMAYDGFGNPTSTQYSGDVSVSGDERTEVTDWIVNTTTWLQRPKRVAVHTGSFGPLIRERWFWYDGLTTWGVVGASGLLTKEENRVSAAGGQGAAGNPVVTHAYDQYGNRISTTDARSCTTTTAYEGTRAYPATITTCLNFTTQFAYDHKFGVKTSVTDPNLQTTTYAYDVFGRPTRVTGPLDTASANGTVSYAYVNFGNPSLQRIQTLLTQTHGGPDVISTLDYFDGLGRIYQQQTEACCNGAIVTDRTYDSRGLVTSVSAPHFASESGVSTTYVHDALGRETRANNPDGTFRTTVYAAGMLTTTDERGTVRKRYFDAYNRLTRVDEVNGTATYTTTHQYDAVGALIQTRNHLGHVTSLAYDLLGRKTTMQDPNMGSWAYGYDTAGNQTFQTDAKNQTVTFAYDLQSRLVTKTYPDGRHIDWTYDDSAVPFSKGRLTRVVDLVADTRFVYNALGEVVQTTRSLDGATYTMSQAYDAMGRVTSRTFPDNETVTFAYNSAGWLAGINGYVDGISYNARGQRVNVWYPNGAVSSFIYHPQNFRMTNRTTTAASTTVQNLSFVHDNSGNISQITDGTTFGTASRTFTYDPLNRLVSASGTFGPPSGGFPTQLSATYSYNAIGDPQQFEGATYAYSDPLHPSAVTSISPGATYHYDANGNMIDGAGRTSAWDADNRLSATTLQGGNSAEFAYDYTGQRVRKTTMGGGTMYYPFPDYEVAPGGVITKYVRFKDEIMAAKKSSGERFFYHADQLGSVHVITDITGMLAQLIEYSPWGRVVRSEGAVNPTKGFNGKDLDDPETGLLYYNGRYYIAGIGRFMSPDPIVPVPGNPQSLNRYTYVLNNPVRLMDPTGYSFFDDIGKWFKKNWKQIVSAVVGAVVAVAVTVLTWNPALGAAAGIMASSTLYGGLTGGWEGAGYGALAGAGYVVGAVLGGGVGAVVAGSLTTGMASELQGGSFWTGFGSAAISGTLAMAAGGLCGCGLGAIATGAASGAVNAAIFGGNVGQGALVGAVSAAITMAVTYGAYYAYQSLSESFVSVPAAGTGRFSDAARAMLAAADGPAGTSVSDAPNSLGSQVRSFFEMYERYVAPIERNLVALSIWGSGVSLVGFGGAVIAVSPTAGPMMPFVAAHGVLMIGAGVFLMNSGVGAAVCMNAPAACAGALAPGR